MQSDPQQTIQAIEEQIQKLRKIRQHWADGHDLTAEEKLKQSLTLELLDGVIEDLIKKRRELKGFSQKESD